MCIEMHDPCLKVCSASGALIQCPLLSVQAEEDMTIASFQKEDAPVFFHPSMDCSAVCDSVGSVAAVHDALQGPDIRLVWASGDIYAAQGFEAFLDI